ncbi:Transcriptional adapter ada2 [Polyrhizophydium stewartii]|uniref:Transcriptional adapter 2 n=1 Tax=Polyrhizophydium stewartii TaxID=2732419 RepID=A0ABR4NG81_9FUNG
MTVTLRKRKYGASEDANEKYHCDACNKDITYLVRIKCAECVDFDLCVECFSTGAELREHKNDHKYRVLEMLDFPIFEPDWGADEELLLVEGLELHGIGNWEQISDHIGTKNRQECAEHYDRVYIQSDVFPNPKPGPKFDWRTCPRARQPGYIRKSLPAPGRPPSSAPANHEIAGFMPGRREFEMGYENDAEQNVKDMEFTDDDTKVEVDLKCAMLNIYNTVLARRAERKKFVFERNLIDFKKIQSVEKRRPKEEKELFQRMRVFAKMMTAHDFAVFMDGLVEELRLRQRIAQLQEYRRMGITTFKEAIDYDRERTTRANSKAAGLMGFTIERSASRRHRLDEVGALRGHKARPAHPLDVSNTEGVELLSDAERQLCSSLRLFPRAYIAIKDLVLKEQAAKGLVTRRGARALIKIDVNKITKLFGFFLEMGWVSTSPSQNVAAMAAAAVAASASASAAAAAASASAFGK